MGFFSRNQPRGSPPVVRPVVVQPSDLAGFSARLGVVEQAVAGGASGPVYEAIRALSESVGGVDVKRILGLTSGDGIQEELQRPWRWFAKACELANAQGDYVHAPRVFNFTVWWKNMEGKLGIGDYWEMWMDAVHPDSYQAISRAVAEALSHLPDDYAVVQTGRDLITAGKMREFIQLQTAQ